jgi:hypothetical protein
VDLLMKMEERFTAPGTDGGPPTGDTGPKPSGSTVRKVLEGIAEVFAARKDAARLKLRRVLVLAALGVVAALAFVTLVSAALVILLLGLAQGLGEMLGGRAWLGQVIAGAGVLVLVTAAIAVGLAALRRASFRRTVARYELRQARQRAAFGRDASARGPE